jgi:RNA polymerase subunit RPABC4/transcription elongation factor Spt4
MRRINSYVVPGTWLVIVAAIAATSLTVATSAAGRDSWPPRGAIWFGTNWTASSGGDLLVVGKRTLFHETGHIAWVAHFKSPADVHRLMFSLWVTKGGKLTELWHGKVRIHNPKSSEYANRIPVKDILDLGAKVGGAYTIEYRQASGVLATGSFRLVK